MISDVMNDDSSRTPSWDVAAFGSSTGQWTLTAQLKSKLLSLQISLATKVLEWVQSDKQMKAQSSSLDGLVRSGSEEFRFWTRSASALCVFNVVEVLDSVLRVSALQVGCCSIRFPVWTEKLPEAQAEFHRDRVGHRQTDGRTDGQKG